MYKFLILSAVCWLTGCADKKISKDFDANVNEFNDFYHSGKEDLEQQLLVFSQKEEESIRNCNKANIKANNISLKELVKILSKLYDTNINYSSDISVDSKITSEKAPKAPLDSHKNEEEIPVNTNTTSNNNIYLNMNDVCLEDVFENLTETYNIGIESFPYGYVIYPKQLRTETFVVDYHNFYRKGKSSTAIVNSQLKTRDDKDNQSYSSVSSESAETFWSSITKTIRSILSTDKERKLLVAPTSTETDQALEDFYVYKESGLVVVTAYPRQLSYIRAFLAKINNDSTRQVLIEAKILEIELSDEFINGIQWDLLKKKLYYSSFGAAEAAIPNIADIHNIQNLAAGNDLRSSVIGLKSNNKNNFNIVMQALSSQGKISVMSSPRILVLNNQRALIKSGEEKYFVTNVKNLTLANNQANVASQSGFDLEPFFSGLALDTTARIINNKELLLHIHPMISRVNDENKLITIDDKNTKIPVAKIQSREADTVVKALSGDIIILGGMTQNLVQLNETGLPINKSNSAIAKVLNLFSAKTHSSNKVELIILLRPTIINVNNLYNREDIGTFKM